MDCFKLLQYYCAKSHTLVERFLAWNWAFYEGCEMKLFVHVFSIIMLLSKYLWSTLKKTVKTNSERNSLCPSHTSSVMYLVLLDILALAHLKWYVQVLLFPCFPRHAHVLLWRQSTFIGLQQLSHIPPGECGSSSLDGILKCSCCRIHPQQRRCIFSFYSPQLAPW